MGTGVDDHHAARFGDKDLAAIAIGFHIPLPLYLIVLGMMFASSSIIAQDYGRRRIQRIEINFHNHFGWRYSSVCSSHPCFMSALSGFPYLGIDALTAQKSGEYIRMVAFGLPAIGYLWRLDITRRDWHYVTVRRCGRNKFFANIPLNYMLIFGFGDIPAMSQRPRHRHRYLHVVIGLHYYGLRTQ